MGVQNELLAGGAVRAITFDAAGRLWLATSSGLSVLDHTGTPFDKADDTWTRFSTSDGLAGNGVRGILFDASGRLSFTFRQALPPVCRRCHFLKLSART
ncbi:MAG: two-component regulator propeller domain-containing protein [Anaerolineae bacterium]